MNANPVCGHMQNFDICDTDLILHNIKYERLSDVHVVIETQLIYLHINLNTV